MAVALSIPIMALIAVLQTTIMPQFRILGGEPDLAFLFVLGWSIHGRLDQTLIWAFVAGICADLLSAAPTGTSVVGLLLIVFWVAVLRSQVVRVGFISIIGLLIIGTFIHKITYMLILTGVGFQVSIITGLVYVALPTVVYNILFMVPIYRIMRFVQRRSGGDYTNTV